MLKTHIRWEITDHCSGRCSYCPTKFWGGPEPRDINDYMLAVEKLTIHYKNIGRIIDWEFGGGEPLEIFEFPKILKYCKENGGITTLNSAGGKLWMDWWAVTPHVDCLNLSYHYWQNPSLVKFIVQTFLKLEKILNISVPIRPNFFDEDVSRALDIEREFSIPVTKMLLFKEAEPWLGLYDYSKDQLEQIYGKPVIENKNEPKTFEDRSAESVINNPSYFGKLCNTGIERVNISADGWLRGSDCNNTHLGNIFKTSSLPTTPSVCKMKACISQSDQSITKFEN